MLISDRLLHVTVGGGNEQVIVPTLAQATEMMYHTGQDMYVVFDIVRLLQQQQNLN